MPSDRIKQREKVAKLYKRYVRFAEEAIRNLSALLPSDQCRADFLQMNSVMSAEEFAKSLEAMANDPERRSQLQKALNRPRRRSFLELGTSQA